MRVGEFYDPTRKDLDFKNRRVRVDYQLICDREWKCYVEKTKTSTDHLFLPMNKTVYDSLKNAGIPP